MTLARLIATGSGGLGARLEVEGLPIEFVSEPGMEQTLSDGRRRVYCVDLFDGDGDTKGWGFAIDETVNIPEAVLESTGSSIMLNETAAEDLAKAFMWAPDVDRVLTAAAAYNATSLSVLSESGFSAGDVVHVGTEAVKVGSVSAGTLSGCTRGYWGTIAQGHWTFGDTPELSYAHVTNRPLSIRGRRARVYLYSDGDDLQGDGGNSGTPVWRGFVTANPHCDEAGARWFVQLGPLTDALNSRLGGELENPMSPRGIYYSWAAPLAVFINEQPAVGAIKRRPGLFAGFFETQIAFIDALNTWLGTTFSTLSSSFTAVADEGGRWTIEVIKGTGVEWLTVTINSPRTGAPQAARSPSSARMAMSRAPTGPSGRWARRSP